MSAAMGALDLIPMRILLDRAVAPARRAAGRLYLPAAGPLVAAAIVTTATQARWVATVTAGTPDLAQLFSGLGATLLAILGLVVVSGLVHGVLTVGAADALAGRPVRGWAAWRWMLRPAALGTWLVGAVAVCLAFLCCFVPALYVLPVSRFLIPTMVDEGLVGMSAVRRAIELAHHRPAAEPGRPGLWIEAPWVRMAAVLLAGYAVVQGMTLVVQLPVAIVQQVVALRAAAEGEANPTAIVSEAMGLQVAASGVAMLLTAAASIYATFAEVAWVREVRRRRDGDDLVAAIAEVTGREAR